MKCQILLSGKNKKKIFQNAENNAENFTHHVKGNSATIHLAQIYPHQCKSATESNSLPHQEQTPR